MDMRRIIEEFEEMMMEKVPYMMISDITEHTEDDESKRADD
jgi:hypothetical protein